MTFLVVALCIGIWVLFIVGWFAFLNYLERFDTIRRVLEKEWTIPGCETLHERINRKWSEVASLVDECSSLHGVPGRTVHLWQMIEPQGTSPVHKADSSVIAESLGRFRSSLVASAEKGRQLCHGYLKGVKPSVEVISLNTLFSLIVDTCRRCSPEIPCILSELKKSSGGWQKKQSNKN